MVESLLNRDTIPGELRRFVQEKIEGNPFYVEEVINSLVESGTLARENGNWRLTRQLDESDVPATVQGVISARLDRLDREMKRVLQEASVIGRAFLFDILKKITEIQEPIDRFLSGLERLDLIRARSLEPELEYIFKHALTQEVVYNGLLKKERHEIHERIGLVMEHLFQDRLTEFYETLAVHFKQGRSVLKAVNYLMKSGEKSLKRFALEESHQYYQEAYDLLCAKPDKSNEEEELLIDLILEWGMVFYYTGNFKTYIGILQAHEDLAGSLNDKVRVGKFYNWLGWSHCWREDFPTAHQILSKALKLGEENHNQEVIGYACMYLCWACAQLGLFDDGIAFGKRAQEISELIQSDQFLCTKSLAGLVQNYYLRGEWKKVLETAKVVLAYGEKHSNIRSIVMGQVGMGMAGLTRGDLPSMH